VPRFIFETKLLSKLSIYKIIWTDKVDGPTISQTFILLIFIKGFQTPLRKLSKGDAMSPLVSGNSTRALLFYLKFFST
jgi:hypothetical protein